VSVTARRGNRRVRRRSTAVTEALDALPTITVLHDCRVGGTRRRFAGPPIDHLVIAPSGVWVVDAKTHYGPLEVRRFGGGLTPRVEQLFINNRERTPLITVVGQQVAAVEAALAGHAVSVRGVICFLDSVLPWVTETVAGIPLVNQDDLLALIEQDGELDTDARAAVTALLQPRLLPG
jgi:hypothetical protein